MLTIQLDDLYFLLAKRWNDPNMSSIPLQNYTTSVFPFLFLFISSLSPYLFFSLSLSMMVSPFLRPYLSAYVTICPCLSLF